MTNPTPMTREQAWAALQHFLDLDNPYLGEDQRNIMRGRQALAFLRSEMERLEDFRAEIVKDAFTAPDADWNTILDSLRARMADTRSEMERLEGESARAAADAEVNYRQLEARAEAAEVKVASYQRLEAADQENLSRWIARAKQAEAQLAQAWVREDVVDALLARAEAAEAQLAQAMEALEFYADPETYIAIGFFPDPPCGEFVDDFGETGTQGYGPLPGERARAALAALDELEAERDVLKHAAALVENPEYVAALQQAGVEYVEQLVTRIAELEAAASGFLHVIEPYLHKLPATTNPSYDALRAALPETEGSE